MEDSVQQIVPEAPVRLWLPGQGLVDPEVRRVSKAVQEYDADLRLQRHEITGDWVVTLGEHGHPIFGFGRKLPEYHEVERILGARDIKRHGKKIMDQLARNAAQKKADDEYRLEEPEGATAEAMAWFYAKHGAKKATRIFVP